VLAIDVSHKVSLIRDGANVGKLALIGRSACDREWPLALRCCCSISRIERQLMGRDYPFATLADS
jgi:hypothetical protein